MTTTAFSRPLKIFVVENHADTLKYFQFYLQMEGHSVAHARTMEEAYKAIPTAQCDLLISDLGLSDGTGWDLLTRLREEKLPHPAFAVAVSGFGSLADRERSKAAGFRYHLLKPFNPDELDRLLEEAARQLAAAESSTQSL